MAMRRSLWVGFAALCVLSGSEWLFDQAWPGMLTGLQRTAVHDGLLAVVFGSIGLRRDGKLWLDLVFGAAAMFGVPAVVFAAAGGHVPDAMVVLALMLVPVVVILVAGQQAVGFGMDEGPLRRMVPVLAGLGGAMLLIPQDWPASVAGRLWLAGVVASVVAAGLAAVRMHRLLAGVDVVPGAALVALVSGAIAAAFWGLGSSGPVAWSWNGAGVEGLRCVVLDGPILLLTVWLLREMAPVALSARFLLIPLVTIVESLVVVRPSVSWTAAIGVVLVAGGGIVLARSDEGPGLIPGL